MFTDYNVYIGVPLNIAESVGLRYGAGMFPRRMASILYITVRFEESTVSQIEEYMHKLLHCTNHDKKQRETKWRYAQHLQAAGLLDYSSQTKQTYGGVSSHYFFTEWLSRKFDAKKDSRSG